MMRLRYDRPIAATIGVVVKLIMSGTRIMIRMVYETIKYSINIFVITFNGAINTSKWVLGIK